MLRFLSLKGCSFSDRDIFFALLSAELWDCSIRLAFCDTFISFGLQTTNLFSYINTFLSNLWGVTNLVLSHESLKFIVQFFYAVANSILYHASLTISWDGLILTYLRLKGDIGTFTKIFCNFLYLVYNLI